MNSVNRTFTKNKTKYSFSVFGLLLLSVFLTLVGYKWTKSPDDYTYWLLRTKEIVFLVGCLSFVLGAICLCILIMSIRNKNFYIKIDEHGLFLGNSSYKTKLIKWNKIKSLGVTKKNYNRYILVFVKGVHSDDEKGLAKVFFNSNLKRYGTPYLINNGGLNGSFDEIKTAIETAWIHYR